MHRAVLLALIIATVPCSLRAQEKPDPFPEAPYGVDKSEVAEALKDCPNAIGEKSIQICAWDSYRRENAEYRLAAMEVSQALASDSGRRELLAQANRAFEEFRKATCAFDSDVEGSMAGSLLYGCLERYTLRRARALKAYANCEKIGNCELPNLLYIYENENKPDADQN